MSASVAHPDRDVSDALVDVARRALARGADTTAALALSRAAELALDGATRGGLYGKATRAADRGGDVPMATRLLELARPLVADDVIGRADLVLLDADLRMRRGEVDRAYRCPRRRSRGDRTDRPSAGEDDAAVRSQGARLQDGRHASPAGRRAGARPRRRRDAGHAAGDVAGDDSHDVRASWTRPAPRSTPHARESPTPRGHLHTLGIAWPLIWLEEFDAAAAVHHVGGAGTT